MKEKDALGRRTRYAPPNHDPKLDSAKLWLQDRDLWYFDALQHHGILPSHYLREYGGGSPKRTALRLNQLYQHGYLLRPEKQKAAEKNKGQPLSYELSDKAITHLQVYEKHTRHTASFKGHPTHQFGVSCMTASIELAAKEAGAEYIRQETILADDRCKEKRMRLPYGSTYIYPDQLFGLRHGDKVHFYAVEVERSRNASEALREKLRPYDEILENKVYRETWGIPNLRVLILTISQPRLDLWKSQASKLANHDLFAFRSKAFLYPDWEVPPVMRDLYTDPWQTTGEPWFLTRA